MKLLEHQIKAYLRDRGLPVPSGRRADTPQEAMLAAESIGGRVVVKALVAAGRRGKAGGVKLVDAAAGAVSAARAVLGAEIGGRPVEAVYVEQGVDIAEELYLSFAFGDLVPRMMVSLEGGVDIEAVAGERPDAVVVRPIDPVAGLAIWEAAAAWDDAGLPSERIPAVAALSVRLYEAFRDADALMLELNPLAVTGAGDLVVVGAMAEIDDNALFRHPHWEGDDALATGAAGHALSTREQDVIRANRLLPGASVRYTELDGDIGLMVSGGGAGLLQHDLVLAAGGEPSCHTDLSPTPTAEKPAALIEAIIANPKARGLLIGFNYLQLARCDLTAQALLIALERTGRDTASFPVVIRLFGPGEDDARRLLAGRAGIRYLPTGATLADGVQAIVAAVSAVRAGEATS